MPAWGKRVFLRFTYVDLRNTKKPCTGIFYVGGGQSVRCPGRDCRRGVPTEVTTDRGVAVRGPVGPAGRAGAAMDSQSGHIPHPGWPAVGVIMIGVTPRSKESLRCHTDHDHHLVPPGLSGCKSRTHRAIRPIGFCRTARYSPANRDKSRCRGAATASGEAEGAVWSRRRVGPELSGSGPESLGGGPESSTEAGRVGRQGGSGRRAGRPGRQAAPGFGHERATLGRHAPERS